MPVGVRKRRYRWSQLCHHVDAEEESRGDLQPTFQRWRMRRQEGPDDEEARGNRCAKPACDERHEES